MNIKKYLINNYYRLMNDTEDWVPFIGIMLIALHFAIHFILMILASMLHTHMNYDFYLPYHQIKWVSISLFAISAFSLFIIHQLWSQNRFYKSEISFVRAEYLMIPFYLIIITSIKLTEKTGSFFKKLFHFISNIFFSDITKKEEPQPKIESNKNKSIVLNAINEKKNNLMSSK